MEGLLSHLGDQDEKSAFEAVFATSMSEKGVRSPSKRRRVDAGPPTQAPPSTEPRARSPHRRITAAAPRHEPLDLETELNAKDAADGPQSLGAPQANGQCERAGPIPIRGGRAEAVGMALHAHAELQPRPVRGSAVAGSRSDRLRQPTLRSGLRRDTSLLKGRTGQTMLSFGGPSTAAAGKGRADTRRARDEPGLTPGSGGLSDYRRRPARMAPSIPPKDLYCMRAWPDPARARHMSLFMPYFARNRPVGTHVLYWCTHVLRCRDNYALMLGLAAARRLQIPLLVVATVPFAPASGSKSPVSRANAMALSGLARMAVNLRSFGVPLIAFAVSPGQESHDAVACMSMLARETRPHMIITDEAWNATEVSWQTRFTKVLEQSEEAFLDSTATSATSKSGHGSGSGPAAGPSAAHEASAQARHGTPSSTAWRGCGYFAVDSSNCMPVFYVSEDRPSHEALTKRMFNPSPTIGAPASAQHHLLWDPIPATDALSPELQAPLYVDLAMPATLDGSAPSPSPAACSGLGLEVVYVPEDVAGTWDTVDLTGLLDATSLTQRAAAAKSGAPPPAPGHVLMREKAAATLKNDAFYGRALASHTLSASLGSGAPPVPSAIPPHTDGTLHAMPPTNASPIHFLTPLCTEQRWRCALRGGENEGLEMLHAYCTRLAQDRGEQLWSIDAECAGEVWGLGALLVHTAAGTLSENRALLVILRQFRAHLSISPSVGKECSKAFQLLVRRPQWNRILQYRKHGAPLGLRDLPEWIQEGFARHASDPRDHAYTETELRLAATHDMAWNSIQRNLTATGMIHHQLRPYWSRCLLLWTGSAKAALELACSLLQRYAWAGRDPTLAAAILTEAFGLDLGPTAPAAGRAHAGMGMGRAPGLCERTGLIVPYADTIDRPIIGRLGPMDIGLVKSQFKRAGTEHVGFALFVQQ